MNSVCRQVMEIMNRAEKLGVRRLSEGQRLIGNIEWLAPEAYLHVLYGPLGDRELLLLESQIERPIPEELKEFYRWTNGLSLFAYKLTIDGWREDDARGGDGMWEPYSLVVPNVFERPVDAPQGMVFFGGYEDDASLLGMMPDAPEIYRFAHGSVNVLNKWEDLWTMLTCEADRLSQLFDNNGCIIDSTAWTTPMAEMEIPFGDL